MRTRRYTWVGLAGSALVLAGALLPFQGRSTLGASFFSVYPYAASGIALLALAAGWAVWRRWLRLAVAVSASIAVTGYAFMSRYYYPLAEYSLFSEPGRRATSIPGWACLETGLFLILAACLALAFARDK